MNKLILLNSEVKFAVDVTLLLHQGLLKQGRKRQGGGGEKKDGGTTADVIQKPIFLVMGVPTAPKREITLGRIWQLHRAWAVSHCGVGNIKALQEQVWSGKLALYFHK